MGPSDTIPGAFVGADGWLLAAVVLCGEPTSLPEVIGAADFLNHAIPEQAELECGLNRLLAAGYITHQDGRFGPTDKGRAMWEAAEPTKGGPIRAMLRLYDTIKLLPQLGPVPKQIVITDEHVRAAYQEYLDLLRRPKPPASKKGD